MQSNRQRPANEYQHGGNHYKKLQIQHWDYVLANGIPYMEAQVIKYLTRWRDKNGMEDLLKAQHYLDKLIEYEKEKYNYEEKDDAARRISAICGTNRVQPESSGEPDNLPDRNYD